MRLRSRAAVRLAKFTSRLIKKLGKGSGATFPGLVARIIDPGIMSEMASMVKGKCIVVMGTNGKTTTNAMIYRALTAEGFKVITNATGANMYNGILSAFVLAADSRGQLDADFACIEVDEVACVKVLPRLEPCCAVLTNISADQMDRLGDVNATASGIKSAFDSVPGTVLILNGDDPVSCALKYECKNPSLTFGIDEQIFQGISRHDVEESAFCRFCGSKLIYDSRHYGIVGKYRCPACEFHRPDPDFTADNITFGGGFCDFTLGDMSIHSHINAPYSIYNTLAAYAGIRALGAPCDKFAAAIEHFDYGNNRENTYVIKGKTFRLHLAKNPAGFRQKISLILNDPSPKDIVILINDYPADGEDISWIWGVDFQYLKDSNAASITVSGTRYCDLGLRFKYEDIPFKTGKNIGDALSGLLERGTDNIYVVVNYSGLFAANNILKRIQSENKGGDAR